MLLLHWKFDPILVSIGQLAIHWYGLLFLAAFLVGKAVLIRLFKAEGVPRETAERLLLYSLMGTLAGARLVHCLFYDPQYYLANPLAILRVWERWPGESRWGCWNASRSLAWESYHAACDIVFLAG